MHGSSRSILGKKDKNSLTNSLRRLPSINASERGVMINKKGGRSPKSLALDLKKKGNDRSSSSSNLKLKHGTKSLSSITAEAVMEMNKNAMSLMKNGKLKRSYETLKAALTAAESGVRRFQKNGKMSPGAENQSQREAWLLAFAATLSNFGCLQRRDNKLQDALRYLQDAQAVETQVFGRPSCSTMVNLSAVLLGLGATEEALSIARDCAHASEQIDPLLHIIALHNYGVTLSHHSNEEMRQSAAPVLMKALKEAESKFGEDHSTTTLIREHCGIALKKNITGSEGQSSSSNASNNMFSQQEGAHGVLQPGLVGNTQQNPTVLPPLHCQQAKKALQLLDYGKMPLTAVSFSPPETQVSTSIHSSSIQRSMGQFSSGNSSIFALPPITPVETKLEKKNALLQSSQTFSNNYINVGCEKLMDAVLQKSFSVKTPSTTISEQFNEEERAVLVGEGNINQGFKKADTFLGANVQLTDDNSKFSVPSFSTVNSEEVADGKLGRKEANEYKYDDIQKNETQFEEGDIAPDGFSQTQQPKRALLCGNYIVVNYQKSQMTEPSYYRFAPKEKKVEQSISTVETHVTEVEPPKPICEKLFMEFEEDEEEEDEEDFFVRQRRISSRLGNREVQKEEKAAPPPCISPASKTRETFFKTIGVNPVERRLKRIKEEEEEEAALRARLRKEAEEAAKKEYFERTLEKIITRTRNRAAAKIQYAWCNWWHEIGKRRRELIIKREEEKARRERSRMAILEHERRVAQILMTKKKLAKTAVIEVVPSVLKCAKKWLEKTAHVRYLAQCKISCNGENNTFFALKVAKIQAAWRGYYTRQKVRTAIEDRAYFWLLRGQTEIREYAAIVIQLAFRRHIARKLKKINAFERYEPPAVRIQRWFRRFMSRRRALGLDKVSKWRREYSARLIQRTWRSYCARLEFFMARLRYKLDEDRRRERTAAQVLQRIGRGFGSRSSVAKRRLKKTRLRNVMFALERQKQVDFEKNVVAAAAAAVPAAYVPTPLHEVEAVAAIEREKYHIGLFVDVLAERERAEWAEALRLRPFEVIRRRAYEDHLCQLELNALRQERAAIKIQKEFRRWLRIRDRSSDGNALLLLSRGIYQVSEYDKKISRIRHAREQEAGRALFGDQTAPMREERLKAQMELDETRPLVRTRVSLKDVRSFAERREVEEELQKDEKLVKEQMQAEVFSKRRELVLR